MEVRDGFIVGVFNYCDRWCDVCALTSWCRLFADAAEMEAQLDSNLKPVVDAPPLPEEIPPPPPRWMQELLDDMNEATSEPMSAADVEALCPKLPPEHERIIDRADEYLSQVHAWLKARPSSLTSAVDNPADVIAWFHTMIPVKIRRALNGLAEGWDPSNGPPDHDSSAKVALLGIDRSLSAWFQFVDRGVVSMPEVQPFVTALEWLRQQLEQVLPRARLFVRPGLDEPDDLAKLMAGWA
jgi:hypothetical protein